jgi:membrane-associated phospholipid phosphatase
VIRRSLLAETAFWAGCLLLAGVFAALAWWSSREYYLPGDRTITFGLQELYKQPWADELFKWGNRLGDPWVLAIALAVTAAASAARRAFADVAVVLALMLAVFAVAAIGQFVERPTGQYDAMRAVFDGLEHPRIYPSPGGFPSGHVFGEVLVYGLIFWQAPRVLRWPPLASVIRVFCVGAIILGFVSPLYLGAHWLSDCIGGALLAVLALALAWRADRVFQPDRELIRVQDLIAPRSTRAAASLTEPRVR